MPAIQTSSRETHSARHVSRTATICAGSSDRRRARGRGRPSVGVRSAAGTKWQEITLAGDILHLGFPVSVLSRRPNAAARGTGALWSMSRQARQRRRRRNHSGLSRAVFIGLGALATTALLAIGGAVAYVLSVAQSAPTVDSLHAIVSGASSQVFAANDTRLGFIQSDELRSPIGWSEIPANLREATVAIEDQRFYKDNG